MDEEKNSAGGVYHAIVTAVLMRVGIVYDP
jgi:hypothetical protein